MKDVNIKVGTYSEIDTDAQKVRNEVFCIEQKINKDIERDGLDSTAIHAVVYEKDNPVSTGRLICENNKYYIGRVATLKEHRCKGLGNLVVKELINWAFNNNISEVYIHAQKHAEEFYRKIGFESYGDVFFEAGIEHISMVINKDVS